LWKAEISGFWLRMTERISADGNDKKSAEPFRELLNRLLKRSTNIRLTLQAQAALIQAFTPQDRLPIFSQTWTVSPAIALLTR
jgi:hypothetical protein